jgi:hypothetical protein
MDDPVTPPDITLTPPIDIVRDNQNEPNSVTHHTKVPKPSNNTFATPEQEKASQDVLEGMRLLSVDLPQQVAAKVATNYAGMTPMGRFLLETLDSQVMMARVDGVTAVDKYYHVEEADRACSIINSCLATAGGTEKEE